MIEDSTARLADDLREHAVDLDRVAGHVRRKILDHVRELEDDLSAELLASDPSSSIDQQSRSDRLEALLALMALLINARFQRIDHTLQQALAEVADHAAQEASTLLAEASGHFPLPADPDEVDGAADPEIEGASTSAWWGRLAADLIWRLTRAMRQGLAVGESVTQLLERLRGISSGRTMTYAIDPLPRGEIGGPAQAFPFAAAPMAGAASLTRTVPVNVGGVLESTRKNAGILARTGVHAAGNAARMAAFDAAAAPVAAMQHISILDLKTSRMCQSRAGLTWTKDGKPIGHDFPFQVPPLHLSCRSIMVPILNGDNPVEDVTFDDWIATRPDAYQRELLGPARYKLFKAGRLSGADLVDQTGRPLTIDEIKNRRSAAG